MTEKPNFNDPNMSLDTLMSIWPETITVFLQHKMLCVGCTVNSFHTINDACREYHLDEMHFRAELQRVIET
ncbi:MAG: DUF1858 domain-containing protein [Sulfitobacter sp.]|jgi:hybrid cluster-associated redox disulfide protein